MVRDRPSATVLIAGTSTRAFAESATRAGYSCSTIDAFGDRDQKARVENVGLGHDLGRRYSASAAATLGLRIDASSVAYVGGFENHPKAVARLARGRALWGNAPETLERVRDPWLLARVVERAGGLFPTTLSAADARRADAGRSWLRKPVAGGGGQGVRSWRPGQSLRRNEIVQERIVGLLASAAFVADGGRAVVLGVSRQLAGDPRFGATGSRYCGSLYPLALEAAAASSVRDIVDAVASEFGLVGVNGIDFIVRGGAIHVLELNPRFTSSMELLERAHDLSIFDVHVRACVEAALPPPPLSPVEVLGKAVLWARRDLVVPDTDGWLNDDSIRDVPHTGDRVPAGHPVCTIFARGGHASECENRLVDAASAVLGPPNVEAARA